MSRGQIIGSDIARVSDNTSYRKAIDASYAPETKIVAFFVNRRGRNFDVVADVTSVVVDKTCKGRQVGLQIIVQLILQIIVQLICKIILFQYVILIPITRMLVRI